MGNAYRALDDARQLRRGLRALGQATAPTSLLPSVLARLELGDAYFPLETPVGVVFVAYNREGISAVMRTECAEDFEQRFLEEHGRVAHPAADPPAHLVKRLREQLQGKRRAHDLRFDLRGLSEFEQAVLLKALEIPFGEVRPYAWIAREIGHPKAVRAVGSALGRNPIPLLIPCHRVVRSDGHLGQYSLGGPWNKRVVLQAEGVAPETLEELARARVRYIGSDTTHVYCYPTCHAAQRITPHHRVSFRSDAEALAAGYRPCRACRPAHEAHEAWEA